MRSSGLHCQLVIEQKPAWRKLPSLSMMAAGARGWIANVGRVKLARFVGGSAQTRRMRIHNSRSSEPLSSERRPTNGNGLLDPPYVFANHPNQVSRSSICSIAASSFSGVSYVPAAISERIRFTSS